MMRRMIDINRLRVFRAVVATGGIHAAAANLDYTPSAVSQQVAALQRESGLTLTERSGRGLRITAAGRALAEEGNDVLDALQRLETRARHIRDGVEAHIAINSFASFAQACLPTLAKELRSQFEELVLALELSEVRNGDAHRSRADLHIRTEAIDQSEPTQIGHRRVVLGEEPYVLVLPPNHSLAGRRCVEMKDLAGVSLIQSTSDEVVCGEIVMHSLRAAGVSPQFVTQVDDHTTAAAFVDAGIGAAILPQLALKNCPFPVVTVKLTGPEPRRRVVALVRETSRTNPVVEAAIHHIQSWADELWTDDRPTVAI